MERDRTRFDTLEADATAGPSLLWYRFDRPTITLGRLQDPAQAFDSAALARDGVPLVVRPTGGRAVFHVDEWTYGAVVPADHPTLGGSLRDSCRALVTVIASALHEAYGLPVEIGGSVAHGVPDAHDDGAFACFARTYGHEATIRGRKLMGSAQRRGRRAYLQQGSLLVGPGHERLVRYGREPRDPSATAQAEVGLAARTTTLADLLGRRPDPEAFRNALARSWSTALAPAREDKLLHEQGIARPATSL